MARMHGKDGSITWSAGYSQNVISWTLNRTTERADGTTLGRANRVRDTGLGDATGTFSCFTDDTTAISDVGTKGTLVLTAGGTKTRTIPIVVTDFSESVGLDNNVIVTYSWEMSDDSDAGFVIA
ncbi:hypothetical protein C4588_07225 [Candidatus Parcubacteria bacterium]|nr:MAG: hypothetical protein C4588_07225 [Candidatus Parcubacteria bacterium]